MKLFNSLLYNISLALSKLNSSAVDIFDDIRSKKITFHRVKKKTMEKTKQENDGFHYFPIILSKTFHLFVVKSTYICSKGLNTPIWLLKAIQYINNELL